jgi:hypothetical protein
MTSNGGSIPELSVYTRTGCHLCDDMLAGLEAMRQHLTFSVNIIDVDADSLLQQEYGHLVPVLKHRDVEICHYFLDVEALNAYFSQATE